MQYVKRAVHVQDSRVHASLTLTPTPGTAATKAVDPGTSGTTRNPRPSCDYQHSGGFGVYG